MFPKIFDIENEQIRINEHILSIPELKAVYDEYENALPAFQFLRNICDPYSPYNQLEEDIKEEAVLIDFPGEYTTEDEVMIKARKKLESLYMSPAYRYYLDNKSLLEKMGNFARHVSIRDGKDGNYVQAQSQLEKVGKVMISFKQLEKVAEEELEKTRTRGGSFVSYDAAD